MNMFDQVIGYEAIKKELLQICDMIHSPEIYERLGAKLPQGVLLYGDPGLGKTLMAKCFIQESGLKAYTVRRNKGTSDFVEEITETFNQAKKNAPSIVFLDDMDKFANEDRSRRDAEEYVAVQAGIDEVKGSAVFVFATANDIYKLPDSLTRYGRFDRKIEVCRPSAYESAEIIKYYLKDKKVSENVNMNDIAMMINYSSCAELETMLNDAAINAAYARRECIEMADLIGAVLRTEYDALDDCTRESKESMRRIAIHEAGHLVMCESLCPGSVGLASLRARSRAAGGFIRRCKDLKKDTHYTLVSLAGKAAEEIYFTNAVSLSCKQDLNKAIENIRSGISDYGVCGLGFLNVKSRHSLPMSESLNARSEAVVYAELERYLLKVREILIQNKNFLELAAGMLMEKETLLHSDIKSIREQYFSTRSELFGEA